MRTEKLFTVFGIMWIICALLGVVLTGLSIYILFQVAVYLDHLNSVPH